MKDYLANVGKWIVVIVVAIVIFLFIVQYI